MRTPLLKHGIAALRDGAPHRLGMGHRIVEIRDHKTHTTLSRRSRGVVKLHGKAHRAERLDMVKNLGDDDPNRSRNKLEGLAEAVYVVAERALRDQNLGPDTRLCGVVFEQARRTGRFRELGSLVEGDKVLGELQALAVGAVERLPELALAARFGEHPRAALERWLVPGVLGMAAGESGEPVTRTILGES